MKFILTDIITVDREVDIVDTCPKQECGADLAQPGAFILWDYGDEGISAEYDKKREEISPVAGSFLDSGEDYLGGDIGGVELRCRVCGAIISKGEVVRSKISDDSRETQIRKGIALLNSRLAELTSKN